MTTNRSAKGYLKSMAVHLPVDLIEQISGRSQCSPGFPLAAMAEHALKNELERIEAKLRRNSRSRKDAAQGWPARWRK